MSKSFYIPPKDRIGFIVAIIIILFVHALTTLYQIIYDQKETEKIAIATEIINNYNPSINTTSQEIHDEQAFIEKKLFDPNIANKKELVNQGFSSFAADNLIKYRQSGGTIYNIDQMYKIYGIDTLSLMAMKDRVVFPKRKLPENKITQTTTIQKNKSDLKKNEEDKSTQYFTISLPPIDPNHAQLSQLLEIGFTRYTGQNLIKYISNGGRIHEPQDLKKIYGMTDDLYDKILPHIHISPPIEEEIITVVGPASSKNAIEESTYAILDQDKKKVNINTASQEELMTIKGIGPVISKEIIKYRERLGGYLDIRQLLEVYSITEDSYATITKKLYVDGEVTKFYIPSRTFKEVLRHPYIDYETTKIVKNISIMNYAEDLQKLIDEYKIDSRLVPYLHIHDPDL